MRGSSIITVRTVYTCTLFTLAVIPLILCSLTMTRRIYSRQELLNIGQSVSIHGHQKPFTRDKWDLFKTLDIARKSERGNRAGRTARKFAIPRVKTFWTDTCSRHQLDDHAGQRAPSRPPLASDGRCHSHIGVWNARSMSNKTTCICDMILDNDLDVLVLTESWLTGNQGDDLVIGDIKSTLPNYDLLHCPRLGSKGGGICIVYRSSGQVTLNSRIEFTSF